MKLPRYVYVIMPHDSDLVYVGSSANVKQRVQTHLHDYCVDHLDLHEAMRKNGFDVFVVDVIEKITESHLEYDWIDFFTHCNDVSLCNTRVSRKADCRRLQKKEVMLFCQQYDMC